MQVQPYASHDPSLILASPESFPFLSLPIELRLKIYTHLLPPRHHKIVTFVPTAGNFTFYNTLALPSSNSGYPFGRSPPKDQQHPTRTRYKLLSDNFRPGFPGRSIYPEILRTCKVVRDEALPTLYGGQGVVWDFGTHHDAMRSFWEERGQGARECAMFLEIAKEIPCSLEGKIEMNERWVELVRFLREELVGLRGLDMTIWSAGGSTASFPCSLDTNTPITACEHGDRNAARVARELELKRWRDWEWTAELSKMEELQMMKITWWTFALQNSRDEKSDNFHSRLAGRMVGDRGVREKMIREGVVAENVILVPGLRKS